MPSAGAALLRDFYESWAEHQKLNPAMDIQAIRDMYERWQFLSTEPTGIEYEEVSAAGVPCLWAMPKSATDNYILYLHGGGWLGGSASSHRKLGGHLAKRTRRTVLLVDYRRVPEVHYPEPVNDCMTAFDWLVADKGIPEHRITIAGDSCGGNMALSIAQQRRDRGAPIPNALVLICPFIDLAAESESIDANRESDVLVDENADSRAGLHAVVDAYLQGAVEARSPLVNALHADLKGMPPMYITVGSDEILLDDSRRLARRASDAGVDVELSVVNEMLHVFPLMAGRAAEANDEISAIAQWLGAHGAQVAECGQERATM